MQRLPSSVSRALVTAMSLGAALGGGALFYERYVNGNPMKIFRDGEGVLRFETRRDVLEQRAAEAYAKLQLEPDSKQLQYEFGLAHHQLGRELDRLAKAGGDTSELRNEDLK